MRKFKLALEKHQKLLIQVSVSEHKLVKSLEDWTKEISQADVAREIGISKQSLNDLIRFRRSVARRFVERVLMRIQKGEE